MVCTGVFVQWSCDLGTWCACDYRGDSTCRRPAEKQSRLVTWRLLSKILYFALLTIFVLWREKKSFWHSLTEFGLKYQLKVTSSLALLVFYHTLLNKVCPIMAARCQGIGVILHLGELFGGAVWRTKRPVLKMVDYKSKIGLFNN